MYAYTQMGIINFFNGKNANWSTYTLGLGKKTLSSWGKY